MKCELNKAIGIFSKILNCVPKLILNILYYTMFYFLLIYSCQICGQVNTIFRNREPLQNEALRIIKFKDNECDMNKLYKTNKILKIADYITIIKLYIWKRCNSTVNNLVVPRGFFFN